MEVIKSVCHENETQTEEFQSIIAASAVGEKKTAVVKCRHKGNGLNRMSEISLSLTQSAVLNVVK